MVWLERALYLVVVLQGVDGSWITFVLADDSYVSLYSSFIMLDLDYGTRNGHFVCCHLL